MATPFCVESSLIQFLAILLHKGIEFGHMLVQCGLLLGNFEGGLAVATDAHKGLGSGMIRTEGTHESASKVGVSHAEAGNLLGGEQTGFKIKGFQSRESLQKGGVFVGRLDEHRMKMLQIRQASEAGQGVHRIGGENASTDRKLLQGLSRLQQRQLLGNLFTIHNAKIGQASITRHIP